MLVTVTYLFALGLAQVGLLALDFLLVQTTAAPLDSQLQASAALVLVAALVARVRPTLQHFAARVSARRCVLGARQHVVGLAARAPASLSTGTRPARASVAHLRTAVMAAGEGLCTHLVTLPLRAGTVPQLFLSRALTPLCAPLLARGTHARMARLGARMFAAGQCSFARRSARPFLIRASLHACRLHSAVTLYLNCLWTRRTRTWMT